MKYSFEISFDTKYVVLWNFQGGRLFRVYAICIVRQTDIHTCAQHTLHHIIIVVNPFKLEQTSTIYILKDTITEAAAATIFFGIFEMHFQYIKCLALQIWLRDKCTCTMWSFFFETYGEMQTKCVKRKY